MKANTNKQAVVWILSIYIEGYPSMLSVHRTEEGAKRRAEAEQRSIFEGEEEEDLGLRWKRTGGDEWQPAGWSACGTGANEDDDEACFTVVSVELED